MTSTSPESSKSQTSEFAIVFFFVAFALRITPALSIFHEICHMLIVEVMGGQVTKLEWTRTYWIGLSNDYPAIVGAYWLEFGIYFLIALANRRPFFIGIVAGVIFKGFISQDFARVADVYPSNYILWTFVTLGLLFVLLATGEQPAKTKSVAKQIRA